MLIFTLAEALSLVFKRVREQLNFSDSGPVGCLSGPDLVPFSIHHSLLQHQLEQLLLCSWPPQGCKLVHLLQG